MKSNKNIEDVKKKEADLRTVLNVKPKEVINENAPSTLIKRVVGDAIFDDNNLEEIHSHKNETVEVCDYVTNEDCLGPLTKLKIKENQKSTAKFVNESPLEFIDISSEEYRIYEFNNGKTIMISEPLKLNVSKSGGHRLFDNSGLSHYIPQGWVRISWKAKSGRPNFVK